MRLSIGAAVACALFSAGAAANDATTSERREIVEDALRWMQGEWRFELGARTGVRVVEAAFPDHLISWRETFDEIEIEGRGYIGYAPDEDSLYSFAAHSIAGEYAMMTGQMNAKGDEIIYRPVADASLDYHVVWRKLDEVRFSYSLFEKKEDRSIKRWTAIFERIE